MKILIVIFSILIFVDVNAAQLKQMCPPREDIPKCKCSSLRMGEMGLVISCSKLQNVFELENITEYLSEHNVKIFNIFSSSLIYNSAEIIDHTNNTVSNNDVEFRMFNRLGHSLEEIFVMTTSGFSTWRWNPSGFDQLKAIKVTLSDVENIKEEFPSINSLKIFSLTFNFKLSYLHKYAFKNLVNLEEFKLVRTNVSNIHRDMLPNPAEKLEKIYITDNKIEFISDDFFSNMPNLKVAFLFGNNIKFLSTVIFQSLVPDRRICGDLISSNIAFCSDHLFRLERSYYVQLDFICSSYPERLIGREISTLNLTDLYTGNC